MFSQGSPSGHRPHLRVYIFMVTLVLGGLFFLLYSNENNDNSGLISAIVGYSENATLGLGEEQTGPEIDIQQELTQLIG